MGNTLICTPNWPVQEFFGVTFGSGDWDITQPLVNLQDKFFINKAVSSDATVASTKFDVDLGIQRDTKLVAITNSNASKDATIRIRATNTTAWTGVVVDGVNSSGATTLNVTEGAAVISVGEIFTIAGDTDSNGDPSVYNVTSVAAGVLGVKNTFDGTGLLTATAGAEVITAHSGDFSTTVFDTGFVDYFGIVQEFDLGWGQAGVWDGKISDEEIDVLDFPLPFIEIRPTPELAQYFRIEFVDTANVDGFISIDGLFIASAFRPTNNYSYGATFGLLSNTTSESSSGGVEIFQKEQSQRIINAKLQHLTVSEAFTNVFDNQRRLDIADDLFVVFDEDDTILLNRRSFPARFVNLAAMEFPFFANIDVGIQFKEKLA